jgi:hypothetical protein
MQCSRKQWGGHCSWLHAQTVDTGSYVKYCSTFPASCLTFLWSTCSACVMNFKHILVQLHPAAIAPCLCLLNGPWCFRNTNTKQCKITQLIWARLWTWCCTTEKVWSLTWHWTSVRVKCTKKQRKTHTLISLQTRVHKSQAACNPADRLLDIFAPLSWACLFS